MESSRILVTGLPDGTTMSDLTIYFQSTRDSGGGDVKDINIDVHRKQAVVTFEDTEVATSVVRRKFHRLKNCLLQVALLADPDSLSEDEEEPFLEGNNQFENHQMGQKRRKIAEELAPSQPLTTTTSRKRRRSVSPLSPQCTVKVTGLQADTSEDLLTNYFENCRRSNGGPVSNVVIKPDLQMSLVTFESPDDARRIAELSPHKFAGLSLHVSLFEEPDPDDDEMMDVDSEETSMDGGSSDSTGITIIASGMAPSTSEDAVRNYFENSRRSGGGEVCDLYFTDDGDALITFTEVEDIQKLLQSSHSIGGNAITVVKQPPKKKIPVDPLRVHVQGLNDETTEDCLLFYLEKFSLGAEVKEVNFGYNNDAIATFTTEPDFKSLFDKVHRDPKGLEGSKLRLEHMPVCSCIVVTGLKEKTSDDTIQLYFENTRRSGGSIVSRVERKTKDTALVYFVDHTSVQSVTQRFDHGLEQNRLDVKAYYRFLEDTATNKTKIPIDADIFDHVKLNHERELQTLTDEYQVELCIDPVNSIVTLSPSGKDKFSRQLWKERARPLETFLQSFKKIEIPIAHELFDEISDRWQKQRSTPEARGDQVYFLAHDRSAQIIGKEDTVSEQGRRLQELILAAEEDTEIMKSTAEVVEDGIPRSKLSLFQLSDVFKRLQRTYQHLKISFDLSNETLHLNGPIKLVKEVQAEVFKLISKMIERTVELPANLINVLKKPHVSKAVQEILNERGIQAVFVCDQTRSLNEIQVLGVDAKSTQEAEKLLLGGIQERNINLSQENTQVLDSRRWKDYCGDLTIKFKVGIVADIPSNTVWVSGLTEDVKECFDEIIRFLEVNTILHETVLLDPGFTRFIFERCGPKLDSIKRDLSTSSVDFRMAANFKGIEISGTAEGLTESFPRIFSLTETIQQNSVPVNKPGMKKFFTGGKGPKLLKTIEDTNNCTIIVSERNGSEASASAAKPGEEDPRDSSGELICSYLTKQGKTISVLKGDITKHRVDAIVNAANEELKHVGGLAAAIVKAGGQEIQVSCDKFVQDNGPLLEGRTLVTPAGMLPCDSIIHTVGPRWNSDAEKARRSGMNTQQERVLRFAITNCLKKAASLRSIAIPAVSSGVFGFPRDLCAQVIIDAVIAFCEANQSCTLSEILLLNNDSVTVKAFAGEMRKRFAGKNQFQDKENPTPTEFVFQDGSGGRRRTKTHTRSFTTPEGVRITMKVGDLAQEQADVLVGTAAQSLNLDQNPCAMALRQAAGQGLQRECSNKSPVAVGDIAVLHQTGMLSCQAVFFAVCSDWDNGKGKKILNGLLAKSLKEADRNNMTSIAFAAIGTGTLRFPRGQVANTYLDEVISYSQKNPATKIKDVRFVLFDKDSQTIQAFADEFKKRFKPTSRSGKTGTSSAAGSSPPVYFSPVIERKPDQLEINVGSICFKVQSGDITNESTEAIAVITNSQLDLSVGRGAGAAILKAGGESISSECFSHPQQNPGSVVVTTAGRLKARALFHVVPVEPFTSKSMKASIIQCLQEAEAKQITSISFPAIGTGILSMSAKSCAHTMLSAIRDFANQQPVHVQLIKMTIFQKEMIKHVRLAMYEASGEKPPSEPGIVQRFAAGIKTVAGYIGLGGAEENDPGSQIADDLQIDLAIFAGCERDLHQATIAVNEVMTENFTHNVITNDAIKNLTEDHISKIHTLELRYEVKATVEKEVHRIEVCGQPEDILSAIGDIHEMLNQIKTDENERIRAEVISKDVKWKYRIGDKFKEYESHLNAQIELAYSQHKKTVAITQERQKYTLNFDEMTEKDESGNRSEIKRVDYGRGIQPPDYWDPQPQDHNGREMEVYPVQLNSSTQEYKNVRDRAKKGCSNIVKIERIQNPTLYGLYAMQKQKMEEANGSNEMWLFHGTAGDNCVPINHSGFDRSYSWEKKTLYGKGVYFARDASYSARPQYSPVDPSTGLRYMFLARVLVGEYTVGKPGLIVSPKKNSGDPTDSYDSVVDQIPHPSIFVVFRDYRSYPEYLITFM